MTAATTTLRNRLIELLEPAIRELDLALWELEYLPSAGGALLRLYIDVLESGVRPDSDNEDDSEMDSDGTGITVEDCARASRAVSGVLEASDPIPGHYTLEVSSPGLDRVLCKSAHFARFVGEPVRVELLTALNGRKKFSGRLQSANADEIVVNVDDKAVTLSLAAIHKARLAPELG